MDVICPETSYSLIIGNISRPGCRNLTIHYIVCTIYSASDVDA